MSPFEFLVSCVATWRLTYLFTEDIGPGDIFLNLRHWAKANSRFLDSVLSCHYCFSLWVAVVIALAMMRGNKKVRRTVVLSLALSGASILIEEARRRIET